MSRVTTLSHSLAVFVHFSVALGSTGMNLAFVSPGVEKDLNDGLENAMERCKAESPSKRAGVMEV
jgi:hypothetical protein